VTAGSNAEFGQVIEKADMSTADGAPVAWMLREAGYTGQKRINGPDLMWRCCAEAENLGLPVYFYGSTPETLIRLELRLTRYFPGLIVAGSHSPSFLPMNTEEEMAEAQRINASGAAVVFVGLGCPKQELWMASQRGAVNAVMIGVGAAFDFHAGNIKRAPLWMQNAGLEWLHRLISEPARLWKRYLVTNTIFVFSVIKQLYFNGSSVIKHT
jgi:N-acetylglucosaminyldiphosphoundecaprenol N-acetyl-beta-D-mannosaminyltransferase